MKRILFVFPTGWDARQLATCRDGWAGRYEPLFGDPDDVGCRWDFDVLDYIDRLAAEGGFDGVTSSSDYPGATVAAAIATRRGLPGSRPEAVIGASHKYYSRLTQQRAVPAATPPFDLVDPDHPERLPATGFPCFVKPVKGAFSLLARRIDGPAELATFCARPAVAEFRNAFVEVFNRLVRGLTDLELDGRWFLAEGLVGGRLVTVEGFEQGGAVEVLGIVDSTTAPGSGSFIRFDYPSALPAEVQERMGEITRRVVAALGLTETLFNLEMTWDPASGQIAIIEVNPRLCGQFADLYQKVDGVNGYEVALALAAGAPPPRGRRQGRWAAAASFPLRVFEPVRVVAAPDAEELAAAEALHPDTLIWTECTAGDALADLELLEDGASVRYGVVNLGGDDRSELDPLLAAVSQRLGYRFSPLDPARLADPR